MGRWKDNLVRVWEHFQTENKYRNSIPDGARSRQPGLLRVMQWNVDAYRNARSESDVLDLIQKADPDVVLVNEANAWGSLSNGQLTELWAERGYPFSTYYQAKEWFARAGKHETCLNIIYSRFPFRSVRHYDIGRASSELRFAVDATIEIPTEGKPSGEEVRIASTHLDRWDETGGERLEEVKNLARRLSTLVPAALVGGDFNAVRRADYTPIEWSGITSCDLERNIATDTKLFDWIEGEGGFREAFSLSNSAIPRSTCWSNRRVDFFLSPSGFPHTIEKCYGYYTPLSDHMPSICDLRLESGRVCR